MTPAPEHTFRGLELGDLGRVFRAEAAYMQQFEPESFEKWLHAADRQLDLWTSNADRARVLLVDGAFAGYELWTATPDGATLVTINVDEAFRGKGLGRALLDRFTRDARAAGHRRLHLGVHTTNPAGRLYLGAGFEVTGTDGDYVLMAKSLG
ncbi:GNAT family N-acetyltransferase [Frondihabitans cladoniiphilus]|uniref:N-acetyltransferase domain-containing protein n=1 Tax=Frondihabitans cladoniiphilus TaxID=715785 RepID=A0ABP8W063_9MICO